MKRFYSFLTSLCVLTLITASCSMRMQSDLKLLEVYDLEIKEPSGISISSDQNTLFIVSDNDGGIYETTLSGEVLSRIMLDVIDLEGVTFDKKENLFWIISENKRKLYAVNLEGEIVEKHKISGKQKHKNSGLEGICYNPNDDYLYMVNEASPKQLLQVSKKGEVENTMKLPFTKDVSGIFCDDDNSFWIVSDESEALIHLSHDGTLLKEYELPIHQAEGVVISNDRKVYIVSDAENRLYEFQLKE
ncbi:SdiA-regulated domain-containing protein [Aureivirga sp. CE67]|uniref:SdiA-regulated domain-containing protein n=1 Tax=Aureivirga sp. CE67 TaxID=1788983 RepID=UPI0018CAE1DA|nr:SdiA-regulated domain-containing protein [Aureivirga sp. CE67]